MRKPSITSPIKFIIIKLDDDYLNNPSKLAKFKELKRMIDQLVYNLYDLTE